MTYMTLPQWTGELAEEVLAVELKAKVAIELGVWALLWAGLLLMAGAVIWDARG